MPFDAQQYIQSLVKAQLIEESYPLSRTRRSTDHPPIVTISRGYGSGGEEVASELSKRLGVKLFDRELMDAIVASSKLNHALLKQLDESVKGMWDKHLLAMIAGRTDPYQEYFHTLVTIVLGSVHSGGVMVGRGAHLILGPRAFRVRIVGSHERCAERVASAEELPLDQALKRVSEVDAERDEYVRHMFGETVDDARSYDLVINSDDFGVADIAIIIEEALARVHVEGVKSVQAGE